MSIKLRQYNNDDFYGNDYHSVREFLLELDNHNYPFGRWDWRTMCLCAKWEWADPDKIEKVGIWEEDGKIVAVATYDTRFSSVYLLILNGYEKLKLEMFLYAKEKMSKDGKVRIMIADCDFELQNIASQNNFFPTQNKEYDSVYPIKPKKKINYTLPPCFEITSLNENFDLYKYGQVLWKGFDHEANGEGPFIDFWNKNSEKYKKGWDEPNINLNLKIFVAAPNGDFVSHCGMWHDKKSKSALVEPVATVPEYRKMGLGKAAVLEGIKRCGELGATNVFVCSSQQFYYSIGFWPYATSTFWEGK
jgi:GNAT superfamily N-acetyltransferase